MSAEANSVDHTTPMVNSPPSQMTEQPSKMADDTAQKVDHPIKTTDSATQIVDHPTQMVELNVGGVLYTTSRDTLLKVPDSLLASAFSDSSVSQLVRDSKGKIFIDRDGVLFRYVLDYLRNFKLVLPENFHERERLKQEAEYFRLPDLMSSLTVAPKAGHRASLSAYHTVAGTANTVLSPISGRTPGFITLGYRGTFAFGRDGLADVKFRKLSRIIVCGKVSLCREVFKDTLNESRDPDRGEMDRYTSRFFLKHTFLEQALDMLQEEGFGLVGCCGTSTSGVGEVKPGLDTEEAKWQHYNEFIFERR
ncbi:BTB/POZ domain-containing protein KCTD12-like [Babylonia areolata]|uniref:BTB/POZ domain-containing protein KCTD12-like n=1 Tax=Babylonia areolata TaxID=304850 RepID=UPI003FD640C3